MDVQIFLAASATVTKAVDFVRNAVDPRNRAPKWVWNLVAFGFGVLAAALGELSLYPGHNADTIITGLAVGAAASGFHEVFDFFSSSSTKRTVVAK